MYMSCLSWLCSFPQRLLKRGCNLWISVCKRVWNTYIRGYHIVSLILIGAYKCEILLSSKIVTHKDYNRQGGDTILFPNPPTQTYKPRQYFNFLYVTVLISSLDSIYKPL